MQYRFLDCTLDTTAHSLSRDGVTQAIEPQVFDLLLLLVRNAGELVTKDQLITDIWGGRIVSESAISARIAAARKAIGDDGKQQRAIRTVARRGLQFVAEVSQDGPSAPPSPSNEPPPRIRYATAEDGVKIAFAVSGSGPPLLRVAYHTTHIEMEWNKGFERPMFHRLNQSHTLIRMDQRGSGLSDLDIDDFSAAQTAKDVKTVLDALGIERTAIFGASSGGMVAAEFAAMYPSVVSHLVTIGGYVDGRSLRGAVTDDAILTMSRAGWDIPGSAFMTGWLSVYFPDAPQDVLAEIAELIQQSCPVENEVGRREFINNHSIAALLGQVAAPALVIHSRGDAVHPVSEGQKMARGIPNAELLTVESRNHVPLSTEPCWESMMTEIEAFLAR